MAENKPSATRTPWFAKLLFGREGVSSANNGLYIMDVRPDILYNQPTACLKRRISKNQRLQQVKDF
jgi:hypothetical protein